MDFFILFALLGLVALARVAVGLGGMPKADLAVTIDWAAVRAQILTSLGAEAVASRARRDAATQRRAAKRHRRWAAKAAAAEGRAQALAAAKAARLAVRAARKAAARAKSAAVAERYGHAAQRAAAAIRAARKAAAVGVHGVVPLAGYYGIKAKKRATRGSTVAANALKRAAVLAVAQQRNAAARAAADAANAAFAARMTAKQAAREAKLAEAKLAEAKLAAHEAKLAALLADKNAVRLAHAVTRAGAKASRKAEFVQWLDENGHTARGEAYVAANEAAWTAKKAEEGYLAHFGFSAEDVVTADKAAYEWRSVQRAIRKAKVVAA